MSTENNSELLYDNSVKILSDLIGTLSLIQIPFPLLLKQSQKTIKVTNIDIGLCK